MSCLYLFSSKGLVIHYPLKQGLKLLIQIVYQTKQYSLVIHYPLKQGLKHLLEFCLHLNAPSRHPLSIKTRIETRMFSRSSQNSSPSRHPLSIKTRIETTKNLMTQRNGIKLVIHYPLKQGLKP